MTRIAFVLCLIGLSMPAVADVLGVGTWLQRVEKGHLVMVIQEDGAGRKITYKVSLPDGKLDDKLDMTLSTQLDGKDAPVLLNGRPTGQTIAVRRLDSHHTSTVLKYQGKEFGTSKAELSADGKVMKVENDISAAIGGLAMGKYVEYWDRK